MLFKDEKTGHTLWVQEFDNDYAQEVVHNPMEDLVDDAEYVRLWSWDRGWCPDGVETDLDERVVSEELYPDKDWQDTVITWEDYLRYARQETGWEDVIFVYIKEHGSQHFYTGVPGQGHDRWDSRVAGIVAVSPDFGQSAKEFIKSYDEWANLPVWEIIDPSGETLYGLGWTEQAALEYACVGPGYEAVSEDWPCENCEPHLWGCEGCGYGNR